MRRLIYFVESNLVWFVIIVAGVGLILPESGKYLDSSIAPLFVILMFVISLTFDAHAVRIVFRKPSRQFLAMGLVYGPIQLQAS
jgi:BASS family bile acid:Na+ symporter